MAVLAGFGCLLVVATVVVVALFWRPLTQRVRRFFDWEYGLPTVEPTDIPTAPPDGGRLRLRHHGGEVPDDFCR